MHRNTFIFSPMLLGPTLQYKERSDLFFAGQITGVEGYGGNIATGLLAGWNISRLLCGYEPVEMPITTMMGSLNHYITHANPADFQPMKANFGILPPDSVGKRLNKRERAYCRSERALEDLEAFLTQLNSER
jgi:methylenetetrahydrofolate--tRNA-(uracil-5-)-methyltransferase